MHEAARQFVERMGMHMEADGLARSAGRIFAHLLLTDGPCSLDELAETVQVSKASVSTNARLLEQAGLLERTCEPGDRRDFYRMRPDAWNRMLVAARARWEERCGLLAAAASALPAEAVTARQRLREAERFHVLVVEELDTLVERWSAARLTAVQDDVGAMGAAGGVTAD